MARTQKLQILRSEASRDSLFGEPWNVGVFRVCGGICVWISRNIGSLRRMGQRVPEDVQVIGFDGIRHFGDLDYCCSTIVQPVEEIAEVFGYTPNYFSRLFHSLTGRS